MIPTNLVADEKTKECELRSLEKQFNLNTDQLRKVSELLQDEMKDGLSRCDRSCNVPMLPSWIVSHPTGQEVGEYIGLDLSGKFLLFQKK